MHRQGWRTARVARVELWHFAAPGVTRHSAPWWSLCDLPRLLVLLLRERSGADHAHFPYQPLCMPFLQPLLNWQWHRQDLRTACVARAELLTLGACPLGCVRRVAL